MKVEIKVDLRRYEIEADAKILNTISLYLREAATKMREDQRKALAEEADEIAIQIYKQLKENGYYKKEENNK